LEKNLKVIKIKRVSHKIKVIERLIGEKLGRHCGGAVGFYGETHEKKTQKRKNKPSAKAMRRVGE